MKAKVKCLLLILFIFFFITNLSFAQTYAKNGMVVSSSKLASQAGVDVLKKGGNAIDASIATAFTLAVTHPTAGNIGGGGFMVYLPQDGKATTIDFREKAPLAASETMFLNADGELKKAKNLYGNPSDVNHVGLKSVGVPGTVAGLWLAHQKYGKLDWRSLVQPAIDLAKNGFPLNWKLYQDALFFNQNSPIRFLQDYFKNENDEIVKFGETWRQPELARTLKLIRDNGEKGFYKGEVAKEIAKFMEANDGLITEDDLQKYEAIERQAIKSSYKDFDIYSMPPPSSGGVTLAQMLNMFELANHDNLDFNSASYVHMLTEIMRRAYADRAQFLGDSDFNINMPLDMLTSKAYAEKRFHSIDTLMASKSDSSTFGQLYDGDHTTHFSVIDKDGNAVSVTYTIEHAYGSGMGSEKLGFIFNNEMGDFNPKPGLTNETGLIGTNPNLIQPEKRMLSSMTPTIVAQDGKAYLIIGSPGGRTIINTVFQTIINVLEYNMPLDQAIETMKIHHQWLPDRIYYEGLLLSPDTKSILEDMGHKLKPVDYLGSLMGILIDRDNSIYIGASDSSGKNGAAVGY